MRQSLRLGSISGIPVGLNWGLLVIAALYTINLAVGVLPDTAPGASGATYWFFSLVGVVAFFGSILAHELGHSVVAQRNGIPVRAITLWLLGGVAELEREADDPGVEFRVAVAGPAVSVALALLFGGMAWFVSTFLGGAVLGATLGYLALLNGALALFNMIPAAPLDGGRVLSAALWKRSTNRHEARARAARAGELFGSFLLVVGIVGLFLGAGTFIMAILGVFLRTAATAERRHAEALDTISTASVASSMLPLVTPISRGITLAGLEAMSGGYTQPVAYPIRGADGIAGIVPSTVIGETPPAHRSSTVVDDLAVGWSELMYGHVDESMPNVLDRARETGKHHVLVFDSLGRQVGFLPLHPSLILA